MIGRARDQIDRAILSYRLRSVNQLGEGAELTGRPFVSNEGTIVIGTGFRLSSRPVQSHLVVRARGRLEIGDSVLISYGAAISSELEVSIGDGTRLGPFTVIMDSDFHVAGDR